MRVAAFTALIAGILIVLQQSTEITPGSVETWVEGFGPEAPMVFFAVYVLGTVLFFPGAVLTLAGGAIFGTLWGTLYSPTGATVGAALSFLVARYLAYDLASTRLHAKLPKLMKGIDSEGWKFVALMRLAPIVPFNALNYALGLTGIKFPHYVISSFIFMFPGAVAYSYLGHVGREAAAGRSGIVRAGLIAIGVLSVMSLLSTFIKIFRRPSHTNTDFAELDANSLRQRLDGNEGVIVVDVRGASEFDGETGHIRGALNIPLSELPNRFSELREYRARPIVVVCLTDKRSTQAIHLMQTEGFSAVLLLRGGMKGWQAAQHPVEDANTRSENRELP